MILTLIKKKECDLETRQLYTQFNIIISSYEMPDYSICRFWLVDPFNINKVTNCKDKKTTNLVLTPFSFPLCIQDLIRDFSLGIKKNSHFIELFWIFEILLTPRRCIQWKVQLLPILCSLCLISEKDMPTTYTTFIIFLFQMEVGVTNLTIYFVVKSCDGIFYEYLMTLFACC